MTIVAVEWRDGVGWRNNDGEQIVSKCMGKNMIHKKVFNMPTLAALQQYLLIDTTDWHDINLIKIDIVQIYFDLPCKHIVILILHGLLSIGYSIRCSFAQLKMGRR